MSTCRRNARRPLVLIALALTTGLVTASVSEAAVRTEVTPGAPAPGALSTFLGEQPALPDVDTRTAVAPSAAVRAAVAALGAGTSVSWSRFGTPASLTRQDGSDLATGLGGDPVAAARTFLTTNRAAFGLSLAEVQGLELVNDATLTGSTAHAVLLRQRWGTAKAVEGGLVAVGVVDGRVVSVTSSLAPGISLNTAVPVLTPLQAVLAAAKDAGYSSLAATDLSLGAVLDGVQTSTDGAGFTLLTAQGLAGTQRTRLAVLPTPTAARLVWETDVLDVADGRALATMTYVDAVTGDVLVRRDAVDTLAEGAGVPRAAAITSAGVLAAPSAPTTFTAAFTDKACGSPVALAVPTGTRQLTVTGNADNPVNDVEYRVLRNGVLAGSSDTGAGTELVQVALSSASTAADAFTVQVCPSPAPLAPFVAPFTATGAYTTDSEPAGGSTTTQQVGVPYAPTWKYFQDSPNLTTSAAAADDVRTLACWTTDQSDPAVNKDLSACQESVGSDASKQPWDVDARTAVPTFTTTGNNAFTADARLGSTLTPGATAYQPKSATRDYQPPFVDDWHRSGCDPATLTPTGGDLDASITNLFVGHNIMHDFAYRLGFTERGYNLQASNRGLTGPTQENDPEVGNVQSGALTNEAVVVASGTTGQALPVTGRDNANQIALQDGVPGITNQYLFQPVLGFYGPCADGDLDFSIFGHEYTHAISNRMVAGPDTGLSGAQPGSMGESWSDLDALEAMHELGIAGKRGEDPESVGAYATGNADRGIRDFALTRNPLNYGDIGFDATGPEVHADGEVWNGVQWHVREALVKAHDAEAPSTDAALQRACATGRTATTLSSPASGFDGCPGNRRWIQYVFDSFLLQASGTPSFVDMKDLMLAAARLRGSSADAATMSTAFAQRGLGADSSSAGGADTDPVAGYASPVSGANGTVTFALKDAATGAPVAGEVYVGEFQARVTPFVRTTGTAVSKTMAAGAYDVLVRADGYGLQRRVLQVTAGRTVSSTVSLARNVASASSGATISGDGVRLGNLIDDDEATDGAYDGSATSTPVAGKAFTVDLHGSRSLQRFSVSALHHPADAKVPGDVQGRLLGVRGLELQVSSDGGSTYRTVYAKDDFFPATAPRTVAPDLVLRDAVLSSPVTADHVRLVVKSNQCTGAPAFAGDRDNDPLSNADCTATANAFKVTVTELQAFGPSPAGFLGGDQATGLARLAGTTGGKRK